jgi:phospholipid/cholesterol/gamma-HCH transport system substrate-binding protein
MRRAALILLAFGALAALIAASASGDGGGGDYKIRAYFDNAGFLVNGEEVRVAGATVGVVDDVTVSLPGEAVKQNGDQDPGKAVAVLDITDSGFEDFRTDASCLIRPQSLLGEKYVECEPTQPRAPGSEPPPELTQIADGEIGAGQYALPIENNGKQVDLDLVNNITRQPETDRFRLILNDLGAALAARGPDLAEVIRRADPALQQTDKVLATLAKQNKQLAQLAKDSDTILTPLAAQRQHLAGFVRNSATAGAAAAERSNDIVAGFDEFPNALRELNSTMVELRRFAEQATPVATDLRKAAPGLTGATKALRPFSRAATIAVTNLGDTTAASSADLAGSAPVVRQLRKVGKTGIPGAKNLNALLGTLRKTGGIDYLTQFLLNASNTVNNFDDYGHFLLSQIQITNCIEYSPVPKTGCNANWFDTSTTSAPASPDVPAAPKASKPDQAAAGEATTDRTTTDAASAKGNKDLLNFLIGDGR